MSESETGGMGGLSDALVIRTKARLRIENIPTKGPKLEKEALASAMVVAPTVITLGTWAGEDVAASRLSFPAATAACIPAFTA